MIVFDPLGQYKNHNEFDAVFSSPMQMRDWLRPRLKNNFRVLYVPKDGPVIENWHQVATIAYAIGNLTLCIDEIGMLCEYGQMKVWPKNQQAILEKIIHYGRHRKIAMIATAQRPTDIALRFRALCTQFVIFQTVEKNDLDYLEARVGQHAVALLPTLPKYDFVVWKETGELSRGRTKP